MRITRRPAWPVVLLLGAGIGLAGEPAGLDQLLELDREVRRWRRVQKLGDGKELGALGAAFTGATADWVRRWPGEELAWRERLRALAGEPAAPLEAERALAGAQRAFGARPELRFPEDTRFLMAEAAVRHGVRLQDVRPWLAAAETSVAEALPTGDHPLVRAYRAELISKARWRSGEALAELAYARGDLEELAREIRWLTAASAVPVADPADRIAVAERARRRMKLLLWRARQARLRGKIEAARRYLARALAARPIQPGEDEPLEHGPLLSEAVQLGVDVGPGTPIPPANGAGPHWLPTWQQLEGFQADGRAAVAAVWDGKDPGVRRAIERLERQSGVRVVQFAGAKPEWIEAVNPLYAAAQLWVVDASGAIRLVGRLQPGGDGWEEAVVGAALRLSDGR